MAGRGQRIRSAGGHHPNERAAGRGMASLPGPSGLEFPHQLRRGGRGEARRAAWPGGGGGEERADFRRAHEALTRVGLSWSTEGIPPGQAAGPRRRLSATGLEKKAAAGPERPDVGTPPPRARSYHQQQPPPPPPLEKLAGRPRDRGGQSRGPQSRAAQSRPRAATLTPPPWPSLGGREEEQEEEGTKFRAP